MDEKKLDQIIQTRRQELGTTQTAPVSLSDVAATQMMANAATQMIAKADKAKQDGIVERQRKLHRMKAEEGRRLFWRQRGKRYASCTLETFVVDSADQERVMKAMVAFRDNLEVHIQNGTNLILVGPAGTGKDHLVAALFDLAFRLQQTVKWTSGAHLWSRLRDSIQNDKLERDIAREFTEPAVLALSDPVPITGALSPYQQAKLYEIVDHRYNHCKAIWLTVNTVGGQDISTKLGEPIVDRLRHGAISLACNWKSYRRTSDGK